jgi:hypothetical protein
MANRITSLVVGACLLAVAPGCGAGSKLTNVRGKVTIDNAPVESGTIHFQSKAAGKASSAGAAIKDGSFQLLSKAGLTPGEYEVSVQAFRKTGRIFNDPQRGKVPESVPVNLADSPQAVTLSSANQDSLELKFSAAKP